MALPRAVAIANAARADLIDRIGAGRVRVGDAARTAVGLTAGTTGGPIAVVRPASADHVVTVLKVGRARNFPVVPRCQLPAIEPEHLRGVIVLDTSSLDRPPAIDIGRRVVTVGAGVSALAVDRAARRARLCLRGLPAFDDGAPVGSLLACGEPGELGTGWGTFTEDLVSATVVGGNGRIARVGGPLLLGRTAWPTAGVPDPLGLLVGGEGRLAVFVDVTLRLSPAPWAAWADAVIGDGRDALLAVLSAARRAIGTRSVDTVLIDALGKVHVRSVSWREQADLGAACAQANAQFERADLKLGRWRDDDRRVRLGYDAGDWPAKSGPRRAHVDLRMSWPDTSNVADVVRALVHGDGDHAPTDIGCEWAFGADGVRLRATFDGPPARHPLIRGARYLLDAGALPIGVNPELRELVRSRMPPTTKVLTTALARAFDPDGVLAPRNGAL